MDEPIVDEEFPEGAMSYLVRFDAKRVNDVDDEWCNDYELEAIDA
jgi:hypothetical protein